MAAIKFNEDYFPFEFIYAEVCTENRRPGVVVSSQMPVEREFVVVNLMFNGISVATYQCVCNFNTMSFFAEVDAGGSATKFKCRFSN